MTLSMHAASCTLRVIGPMWDNEGPLAGGHRGVQPNVGLTPTTPVKAAGMRMDPPESPPWCSTPMFRAAATAAPPEEPPGVRRVSHGFRVAPNTRLSVTAFQPNSGVLVLPNITAPASRNRRTGGAS